jgi:hypothetical protein
LSQSCQRSSALLGLRDLQRIGAPLIEVQHSQPNQALRPCSVSRASRRCNSESRPARSRCSVKWRSSCSVKWATGLPFISVFPTHKASKSAAHPNEAGQMDSD